jgi:hypothetical protein
MPSSKQDCTCPQEKSQGSAPMCRSAVRSPQSGLLGNYREKWASFAYLAGKGVGISLQSRLRGGESGIRFPPFSANLVKTRHSDNFLCLCAFQALSQLRVRCPRRPPTTSIDHNKGITGITFSWRRVSVSTPSSAPWYHSGIIGARRREQVSTDDSKDGTRKSSCV